MTMELRILLATIGLITALALLAAVPAVFLL